MFKFGQRIEHHAHEPMRQVRIVLEQANGLPKGDISMFGGTSDPYVVLSIADRRWQSPVCMKTCDPHWSNLECDFSLTVSEVAAKPILRVEVWDFDSVTPDDLLGTVEIDISDPALLGPNVFTLTPAPEFAHCPPGRIALDISVGTPSTTYTVSVWENERWSHTHREWSKDHLSSSDRPAWFAGPERGGKDFKDAIPEVPEGYKTKGAWMFHPMAGTEEGWLYGHGFSGPWHQEKAIHHTVRTRQWLNEYHDHSSDDDACHHL
ncbi:C2 domain-containing protein [Achlya hypogyna]|uniref:C2 domain-containing protein n=1 Tax=Achlya hypogyna TaxID=1202772 RepID=A0A1V9YAX2_ACHHY|nr:C2 domain-containing protein [Achlya hypogyna]